jgi:hypothetical protein
MPNAPPAASAAASNHVKRGRGEVVIHIGEGFPRARRNAGRSAHHYINKDFNLLYLFVFIPVRKK